MTSKRNKELIQDNSEQDEARKILVTSIAADIYENLKQNGDIRDVLNSVFNKQKRGNILQNLADSLVLRGSSWGKN